MLMSRFNLAYVLEGAKLENWGRGGGGAEGAHLAGQERDW